MTMPEWIKEVPDKINTFVVDPDLFYPEILADIGISDEDVNQYWLEVAFAFMKFDFDVAVRMNKAVTLGIRIVRLVRSDDGRKQRWNLTMHPPGEKDFSMLNLQERSREIRGHYRRVRGFIPA